MEQEESKRELARKARITARRASRAEPRWDYHKPIEFEYHKIDDDGQCKVMIYLHRIVDCDTLVSLTVKEGEREIWFYLPGMSSDSKPWAVARKGELDYVCHYNKRALHSEETFKIYGKVRQVITGDLLRLDFNNVTFNVRLWETVAPDFDHKHFDRSKKHLERQIEGQDVVVYCRKQNSEGELLGIVKRDDKNINVKMIAEGYAAAGSGQGQEKYLTYQVDAKNNWRGLWSSTTTKAEEWF